MIEIIVDIAPTVTAVGLGVVGLSACIQGSFRYCEQEEANQNWLENFQPNCETETAVEAAL